VVVVVVVVVVRCDLVWWLLDSGVGRA